MGTKLIKVRTIRKHEVFCLVFLFFIIINPFTGNAQSSKKIIKTVVIDAGHGGHDPGCQHVGFREKDITLKVALKLGQKIESLNPDVKVIFTRTTDVFVELAQRAAIANKNNADLFVSVHCNSTKNVSTYGTETFSLGLHRAESNLEVAKRENDVILMEEGYTENYGGFDPNSPEAHIYFSLFQNAYMDQSLILADKIEAQISKSSKRASRGVKQAGFLVLWKTKMPSVLIELGFLSNKNERDFLTSPEGVEEMSDAIAKAVLDYKKSFENNGVKKE